jgi:hypothetical protein
VPRAAFHVTRLRPPSPNKSGFGAPGRGRPTDPPTQ